MRDHHYYFKCRLNNRRVERRPAGRPHAHDIQRDGQRGTAPARVLLIGGVLHGLTETHLERPKRLRDPN